MDYKGFFRVGKFKKRLVEEVKRLTRDYKKIPLEEKKHIINELTESYFEQTGYMPDSITLNFLSNWLLDNDLSNPDPDKISKTKYPILSNKQSKARNERELSDNNIEIVAISGDEKKGKTESTQAGKGNN